MVNCAVAVCVNHSNKTKGQNISYHTFPVGNPALCRLWVTRCKRKDKFNEKNARICSIHFTPDAFQLNPVNEMLNVSYVKSLKRTAVPTEHLRKEAPASTITTTDTIKITTEKATTDQLSPPQPSALSPITPSDNQCRMNRYEARCIRKRALEHIQQISPKKTIFDPGCSSDIQDVTFAHPEEKIKQSEAEKEQREAEKKQWEAEKKQWKAEKEQWKAEKEQLEARNRHLEQEAIIDTKIKALLKKELSISKNRDKQRIHSLNAQLLKSKLSNSLKSRRNEHEVFKNKFTAILKRVFTEGQIRCLLNGGKRVNWVTEDIAAALTLKSISHRAYNCIRSYGFPLPSISTLRSWTKGFTCEPGIIHNIITILKPKVAGWTELEKLAVLSFDEMNVDGRKCYDHGLNKFLGPYHNVQVAMVRGLTKNWKQPIFYDFDVHMTDKLLIQIIKAVQRTGLIVCAVVCDMDPKNQTWTDLKVTQEKSFFQNPDYDDRRIWALYDTPHLLKLIRSHFLDQSVTIENGVKVDKKVIEDLLSTDETAEFKVIHHISYSHINVKDKGRQNVRLAAQLLSRRTAVGVKSLLHKSKEAKFFSTFNDGFDVLNSRLIDDKSNRHKSAYGSHFIEQDGALEDLKVMCFNARFGTSKKLLPCQRGFIMTIESVRGLYQDIIKMGGKFILTSRLNQDCLKNFFSRIRNFGSFCDNPLPSEVRTRIKFLILSSGAGTTTVSPKASTDEQPSQSLVENSEEDLLAFITNELFIDIVDEMDTVEQPVTAASDDPDALLPEALV